jgi:hypothetical protein
MLVALTAALEPDRTMTVDATAAVPLRYAASMPKRSSMDKDSNMRATAMGLHASDLTEASSDDGKDPAAVALGRKGGLEGGKARASKMTASQRSDAAKRAAQARWRKG